MSVEIDKISRVHLENIADAIRIKLGKKEESIAVDVAVKSHVVGSGMLYPDFIEAFNKEFNLSLSINSSYASYPVYGYIYRPAGHNYNSTLKLVFDSSPALVINSNGSISSRSYLTYWNITSRPDATVYQSENYNILSFDIISSTWQDNSSINPTVEDFGSGKVAKIDIEFDDVNVFTASTTDNDCIVYDNTTATITTDFGDVDITITPPADTVSALGISIVYDEDVNYTASVMPEGEHTYDGYDFSDETILVIVAMTRYLPSEMDQAILSIPSGGGTQIRENETLFTPYYMSNREKSFGQISGYRTGALSTAVYYNTDPTKPRFSLGSSGNTNYSQIVGPIKTNGAKTFKVVFFPVYWSTNWYTSNLWLTESKASNNYSPASTIYATINLGGRQYSVSYWKNLYGDNVLYDVQDNPDHPAWQTVTVDLTGIEQFYLWFRTIDMDTFIQSISLY